MSRTQFLLNRTSFSALAPPDFGTLPLNISLHSLSSDVNSVLLCLVYALSCYLVEGTTFQILPKKTHYIFSTSSNPTRGAGEQKHQRLGNCSLLSSVFLCSSFCFRHILIFPILFDKIKEIYRDKVY